MTNKRKRGTPTLWLTHVLTDSQLDGYQHDKFARRLKHVHFLLSSTSTPTAGEKPKKNQKDNFNEKRERNQGQWRQPLLQPVREYGYHHNGITKPDNRYRRVGIESQIWDSFIHSFIHLFRQDCRKAKVDAYQSHAPDWITWEKKKKREREREREREEKGQKKRR